MNSKLALAAVAVVGLVGTAHAADLAKKAPAAANYVKVCDAYGAGFFYIPGTDTCLKVGGYVRLQMDGYYNNRGANNAVTALSPFGNNRSQNQLRTLARGDITLDARSNTEFGLLRSYIEVVSDVMSYGTSWGYSSSGSQAATATYLKRSFIQFGGLTAGRAESFFDFFNSTSPAQTLSSTTGPATEKDVNLLAYTFSFGNGITASVSIEDPSTAANGNAGYSDTRRQTVYYSGTTESLYPGLTGYNSYGGVHTPDLVANVNISQAWGSAQIAGVLHDDYSAATGYANTAGTLGYGADKSKLGWAVLAGVSIKLPSLGPTDTIAFQAAYGKGATSYVTNYNGLYDFYAATNTATGEDTIEQTKAWTVVGGFHHDWTKTLGSSIMAAYSSFDAYSDATTLGIATASLATTSQDRRLTDVRANLAWKPVTGLAITGEVDYLHTDLEHNTTAATGLDRDTWTGSLRIQRNF